jgi:hypothetical protein
LDRQAAQAGAVQHRGADRQERAATELAAAEVATVVHAPAEVQVQVALCTSSTDSAFDSKLNNFTKNCFDESLRKK